jgi:hypothetical protein
MVPFAMGIWSNFIFGYKDIMNCFNSIAMISYSKGDLQSLLDINFYYSFIFMIVYYLFQIFMMHSAFHLGQTIAIKNVVMLFSLKETDVISYNEGEDG